MLDFLNVTKYPPSLFFLLMTLGPASVLCAYAERLPRAITQPFVTFGRVPFAFYVAHILVIHLLSMGLGVWQGFEARQFVTIFFFYPAGSRSTWRASMRSGCWSCWCFIRGVCGLAQSSSAAGTGG